MTEVDMKLTLKITLLLFLVTGTLSQGFDLSDALGGDDSTPAPKPRDKPKAHDPLPETPERPEKPKEPTGGDSGGLDILDAFDFGPTKAPSVPAEPKKPADSDPNPRPDKPAVHPPKSGGGGGSFDDSDLHELGGGDYKPDGGRAQDPGYDPNGGAADQPQEAGSGQIAGIASAIGVAILGAASSYFAYQKKKLCFKLQGGEDPESGNKGHHGTQSEPQVLSNLLSSS